MSIAGDQMDSAPILGIVPYKFMEKDLPKTKSTSISLITLNTIDLKSQHIRF